MSLPSLSILSPRRLLALLRRPRSGGHADNAVAAPPAAPAPAALGQFLDASFSNGVGSRPYKLYVPAALAGDAVPLVVMLHGCAQTPDDFAIGTRMNAAADGGGFLVCYPAQIAAANQARCWNWFNAADQQRDQGEAGLLAGIVRAVMQSHPVDPRRVYVAGLSAGGATAAVLGRAYPEIFAAIGVHSGLACGAAHDLTSAITAMRQGADGAPGDGRHVPTIIFHGDRDHTVHPDNARQVLAQALPEGLVASTRNATVAGGHAYSVTMYADARGVPAVELWLVHGAGHAWSGGARQGSFTDPRGPDATDAMLRFFRCHQLVPA